MAEIIRADGGRVQDPAAVLASQGLTATRVALESSEHLDMAKDRRSMDNWRAEAILAAFAHHLPAHYAGRDVVALFPGTEGLDGILASFHRCHVHDDDEVRLILAGEGAFGFVLPDGDQVEITVAPGDLIAVPAGVEHWFRLTETRTIIAIRLFGANPHWQARYTDTPIRFAS